MLLCLFTLALNLFFFFFPEILTLRSSETYLTNLISSSNNIVSRILIIGLIIAEAIILNAIILKHRLNRTQSTITAAVFALYCSYCLSEVMFHEVIVANLFAILSLRSLFRIYKKHLPITSLFNAGFFIGIAGVIYTPYLILSIPLFMGLFALRSINIKEILQLVVGLMTPYFFLSIALYYFDPRSTLYNEFIGHIGFPFNMENTALIDYMPLIIISLLLLITLIFKSENSKKKKFDAIKKIEISYWIMLFSIPAMFFVKEISRADFILLSIPLSINLAFILETSKSKVVKEFIFLVFIGIYFLDLVLYYIQ